METETWSESPDGRNTVIELILASEEINPKEPDWEPQFGIQVEKSIIWVRSFEIEKSQSFARTGYPALAMDVKASKDKYISA